MTKRPAYSILIEPLSEENGGGFIPTVPDLPGCMSDGETAAEAVTNVQGALKCWLEAAQDLNRTYPEGSTPRRIIR